MSFPCLSCKCSPFAYRVCTCRVIHSHVSLHVYELNVKPAGSNSLFLDNQVVTLLLGEICRFARAQLRVYRRKMGCKRSFKNDVCLS